MNKEETAEMIVIMQAYVDGKEIESRDRGGQWKTVVRIILNCGWNTHKYEYRIKAVPRELWVNIYDKRGGGYSHGTPEMAKHEKGESCIETIKVREVLENE